MNISHTSARRRALTGVLSAAVILSFCGCSAKENLAAGDYTSHDIGGVCASGMTADGGVFGIEMATADTAFGVDGDKMLMAGEAAASSGRVPEFEYSIEAPAVDPQAGLLTGGEWNDNEHWADWKALYETHDDWNGYKDTWRINARHRLTVKVQNEKGEPLAGAKVSAGGWMEAVTDNKGMAYLFGEDAPGGISVTCEGANGLGKSYSWSNADDWKSPNMREMTETFTMVGGVSQTAKKLDLMIMCDTTGSMADELEYLKAELGDIVQSVKAQNANIPVRVSVNFYRDEGDEYVVREFPFSEDINAVVKAIGEQRSAGGGDFPEAVHTALKSAVDGHAWDEDSVKIMFLVLDAPPHGEAQIVDEVNKYTLKAASMGIRIVPVASSGIDKSTEYLLRVMAQQTGGTYTFLTNDSGIGGDHIEPTVGAYNVEKLNDMMVRIVNGYLS